MFQLDETQKMIQEVMRQFCVKEIQPHITAMEDGELSCFVLIRKMFETLGLGEMTSSNLEKVAEGRDTGEVQRRDAGLEGHDPLTTNIVLKELSRVSPGLAMSFGASLGLAGNAIVSMGTGRQIREYGRPLMNLDKIGAWCLTEPGAGSDAFGSMKSTARPNAEGGYVINGTKTFITNGPVADIFLVYAKLDRGEPPDLRRVHTFILERGMKGLSTSAPFHKMGMKESPTSEVIMDDVQVDMRHILGEKEKEGGRADTKESLGTERSGIPSMCWGIIERCYEESLAYARERVQFKRPIGDFQAIQLRLARMYIHLKNTENTVFRLAWMQRQAIRDVSFINASKAYTSMAAVEVASEAIQVFGGYGYMREYPVEKMYRDAKLLELGAGTTDINLMTCARNELDVQR